MTTPQKLDIQGAHDEDSIAELLRLLLSEKEADFREAERHPAASRLASIFTSPHVSVPVLNLAAVLPDLETRKRRGLHVARYEAEHADDTWYLRRLDTFFASGVRGSLLALKRYTEFIGRCCVYFHEMHTAPSSSVPRPCIVTKAMSFSPTPRTIDGDVERRFTEYAQPLLDEVAGPAGVLWICLGSRDEGSLQWGGSLFVVVQSSTPEALRSPVLTAAIEKAYGLLNGAFHRTIVDSGHREEAAYRLEQTYFAFGHELKNRLDTSGMKELRNSVRDEAPHLLREADDCFERFKSLSGLCGVFTAVAKAERGELPAEWIGSVDGPGSVSYHPTEQDRVLLSAALKRAVAAFIYVEDPGDRLTVRCISSNTVEDVCRPSSSYSAMLPPFSEKTEEPHLCFLSGLSELCRNAARAALATDLAPSHVDFSVDVASNLVASVTLYNPVQGRKLVVSKSIRLLNELFRRFDNAVELLPAERIEGYPNSFFGADGYVHSRFIYSPMKLRFESVRRIL